MGLFKKIKKLFSKKIDTEVPDNNLISLVLSQTIKYGRTLEVKPGWVAVFVAKGKVADIFTEGIHRIELGYIPILSRILKLARPDKKGNLPTKFYAELYMLNLNTFNQDFLSDSSVTLKDNKYKKLNVKLKGEFTYQICSPVEFLEALFTQYGTVKNNIAKQEISNWVSSLVVKKVQKNKPDVESLHARATQCFEGLIEFVNKELFDCGVKVTNINITETVFPKKIFKNVKLKYTEFEQPNSEPNFITNNNLYGEQNNQLYEQNINYNTTNSLNNMQNNFDNYTSQNNDYLQNDYINQNYNNINNYIQQDYNTQQNNVYMQQSNVNTQQNFDYMQNNIENNVYGQQNFKQNNYGQQNDNYLQNSQQLNEEIIKSVGYKVCLNCGAYNSTKSEHCFNCKCKI